MFKSLDESNERNPDYLKFFRKICNLNENGVTANQEIIFKYLENNPNLKFKIFIPIKM